MDSYTCITCRLFFETAEAQRAHYRTPWHCFNLKRKVAGLVPVSEEQFEEKVQQLKQEKNALVENTKENKMRSSKKQHKFNKGKARSAANNLVIAARELGVKLEDENAGKSKQEDSDSDFDSEPEVYPHCVVFILRSIWK